MIATTALLICAPQHGRMETKFIRSALMAYENILVETDGSVGIITLNRPQALNALNNALMDEVTEGDRRL